MNKKQNSIIRMSSAVSGVFDSNSDIVNTTPGLSEAANNLDGLLSETDRHLQG